MIEIWKDLKNHESFYLISSLGKVKSKKTGRILKPVLGKRGYLTIMLSLGKVGKYKLKTVHRALAETFIENPTNRPHINHKDCNPLNNSLDNLEWCTNGENIQHAYDNNLMPPKRKRAIKQLSQDGKLIKIWPTLTHTRRFHGLNASNIVQVCQGKRQTAYGFKWEYA